MEKYCKANGYAHDADVVYGDTDSVGAGWLGAGRQGGAGLRAEVRWQPWAIGAVKAVERCSAGSHLLPHHPPTHPHTPP